MKELLKCVVYMLKRTGPRTDPWSTPQEERGEVELEAMIQKERDDKIIRIETKQEQYL